MKLCSSCGSRELLRITVARQASDGSFITVERHLTCSRCSYQMTAPAPENFTDKEEPVR